MSEETKSTPAVPPGVAPPATPPVDLTEEDILRQFENAQTLREYEAATAALHKLRGTEPPARRIPI